MEAQSSPGIKIISRQFAVGNFLYMSPSLRAERSGAKSLLTGTAEQNRQGVPEVPIGRFFGLRPLNDAIPPSPLTSDSEGVKRRQKAYSFAILGLSVGLCELQMCMLVQWHFFVIFYILTKIHSWFSFSCIGHNIILTTHKYSESTFPSTFSQ